MAADERTPDLRVGRIVGAFGLKGEVKVEPLTEYLERFESGAKLNMNDSEVVVARCRIHKGQLIVQFEGIHDRTRAETLQWQYLSVPIESRPNLKEDEFYTKDLVGLCAVTENGETLGNVEKVLPYPSHDVIVIGDLMIPAVREFVKSVDLAGGRIVVRLIEGMRTE